VEDEQVATSRSDSLTVAARLDYFTARESSVVAL